MSLRNELHEQLPMVHIEDLNPEHGLYAPQMFQVVKEGRFGATTSHESSDRDPLHIEIFYFGEH